MEDEVKLLARLRNRERDSIDDAIRVYTPYLSTVLIWSETYFQKRILRK